MAECIFVAAARTYAILGLGQDRVVVVSAKEAFGQIDRVAATMGGASVARKAIGEICDLSLELMEPRLIIDLDGPLHGGVIAIPGEDPRERRIFEDKLTGQKLVDQARFPLSRTMSENANAELRGRWKMVLSASQLRPQLLPSIRVNKIGQTTVVVLELGGEIIPFDDLDQLNRKVFDRWNDGRLANDLYVMFIMFVGTGPVTMEAIIAKYGDKPSSDVAPTTSVNSIVDDWMNRL